MEICQLFNVILALLFFLCVLILGIICVSLGTYLYNDLTYQKRNVRLLL